MAGKKTTGMASLMKKKEEEKSASTAKQEVQQPKKDERTRVVVRLAPEKYKKLRMHGLEEGETVQALLEYSIDLLFAERGI